MASVAFLGLGVMGYPMAGHLKRKGGHEVAVVERAGVSLAPAPAPPSDPGASATGPAS